MDSATRVACIPYNAKQTHVGGWLSQYNWFASREGRRAMRRNMQRAESLDVIDLSRTSWACVKSKKRVLRGNQNTAGSERALCCRTRGCEEREVVKPLWRFISACKV